MKKTSSISLPADFCFNASLRKVVKDIFIAAGFSHHQEDRLALVFDEVFMNAIRYGSTPESMIHIKIEWIPREYVSVWVCDEGGKTKCSSQEIKKHIQQETENNDLAKLRGRGLAQITKQIVDQLDISDSKHGGVCVNFTKHIH